MTEINHAAKIKIERDHAALKALGFRTPPTLFEVGATAGAWTEKGYRRVSAEFDAMPDAHEALLDIADRIKAEDRRDHNLDMADLWMEPSGEIITPYGNFASESQGARSLFNRVQGGLRKAGDPQRGVTPYLLTAPSNERAATFNRLVDRLQSDEVLLRVRKHEDNADLSIYAVASQKYKPFNVDKVARSLASAIKAHSYGGAAKLDGKYDGQKLNVRAVWHNDHNITEAGCGDVFRFGVQVSAADDLTSAVHVKLVAWINQCLNYIVIGKESVNVGSRRHTGRKSMESSVRGLVRQAMNQTAPFLEAWHEAGRDNLLESLDKSDPKEVIRILVKRGFGKVAGTSEADSVTRFHTAWLKQPGYSRLAFVNALTRAAHESSWASPWTASEIESQAGKLVFVNRIRA